ncbi:hypothetical protein DNU06_04160 [Putridiphycobacter roseus]|uniref:Lipoprotein n=1 Tax=Putridiphycobacter roseus TaxID=2219161 RepID=A0A2W1N435_9FLAO|nr:hypothetical protein [Putridiphycobacter roseus]PZE17821.1 hypothetical protein DNU06_04160 [Putridiphycobacter roseus]
MKKVITSLTILCLAMAITSCKKYGCTDPIANNYDGKARSNNLLCTYEGSLMFWYDEYIRDSLDKKEGVLSLEYYVEDIQIDSLELNNPQEKEPLCGKSEIATYETKNLEGSNQRFVKYKIFDQLDQLIYSDIVEMKAGECVGVRLK